jgi:hypothetical protein
MSAETENSETVRTRRREKRRRFVAPRQDATLSHLVKTNGYPGLTVASRENVN